MLGRPDTTLGPEAPLTHLLEAAAALVGRRLPTARVPSRQVRLLRRLATTGPLSGTELARIERMDAASVSLALDALDREGLISRDPMPGDRRVKIASISQQGRVAVADGEGWMRQAEEELLGPLSAEERRNLRMALAKLIASAER
jgi:DNA-binding MarR family transcriptional regulator